MNNNPGWPSVNERLPDPLQLVWISDGKGWTRLGCRASPYLGLRAKKKCYWAILKGTVYEYNETIGGVVVEEDDLNVQFWHPVPKPPKI